MTKATRYVAFISYRHTPSDVRWAKWLHMGIEGFRTPASMVRQGYPKRLVPVFRDHDELPVDASLSENLLAALEASDFLVVVCSPRTPMSKWVGQEIETFQRLGKGDRVLALLIEGEPAESFPAALYTSVVKRQDQDGSLTTQHVSLEPLAADVRGHTDQESSRGVRNRKALLRVVAGILGCRFDDLWQREARRRRRVLQAWTIGLSAVTICMATLAAVAWLQRTHAIEQRERADAVTMTALANLRIAEERAIVSHAALLETTSPMTAIHLLQQLRDRPAPPGALGLANRLAARTLPAKEVVLSEDWPARVCLSSGTDEFAVWHGDGSVEVGAVISSSREQIARVPRRLHDELDVALHLTARHLLLSVRGFDELWTSTLVDRKSKSELGFFTTATQPTGLHSTRAGETFVVSLRGSDGARSCQTMRLEGQHLAVTEFRGVVSLSETGSKQATLVPVGQDGWLLSVEGGTQDQRLSLDSPPISLQWLGEDHFLIVSEENQGIVGTLSNGRIAWRDVAHPISSRVVRARDGLHYAALRESDSLITVTCLETAATRWSCEVDRRDDGVLLAEDADSIAVAHYEEWNCQSRSDSDLWVTFPRDPGAVATLVSESDGTGQLLTVSQSGTSEHVAALWPIAAQDRGRAIGDSRNTEELSESPDGKRLALAMNLDGLLDGDRVVLVFDLSHWREVSRIQAVAPVAFHWQTSDQLVVSDGRNRLRTWSASTTEWTTFASEDSSTVISTSHRGRWALRVEPPTFFAGSMTKPVLSLAAVGAKPAEWMPLHFFPPAGAVVSTFSDSEELLLLVHGNGATLFNQLGPNSAVLAHTDRPNSEGEPVDAMISPTNKSAIVQFGHHVWHWQFGATPELFGTSGRHHGFDADGSPAKPYGTGGFEDEFFCRHYTADSRYYARFAFLDTVVIRDSRNAAEDVYIKLATPAFDSALDMSHDGRCIYVGGMDTDARQLVWQWKDVLELLAQRHRGSLSDSQKAKYLPEHWLSSVP